MPKDPLETPRFNLDLSAFKLGRFHHILKPLVHSIVAKAGTNGDYYVVSTQKYPFLDTLYRKEIDSFTKQAAKIEEEWGFREGELMRLLYVVACVDENAHVRPTNPSIVIMCNSTLENLEGRPFITSHELAHVLDVSYGITKNGWLRTIYNSMTNYSEGRKFFRYIAEHNFLPCKRTGHPWDNVEELFASLVNSIRHPSWYKKIKEADAITKNIYLLSLAAIYHDLAAKDFGDIKLTREIGFRMLSLHDMLKLDVAKPRLVDVGDGFLSIEISWTTNELEELMDKIIEEIKKEEEKKGNAQKAINLKTTSSKD